MYCVIWWIKEIIHSYISFKIPFNVFFLLKTVANPNLITVATCQSVQAPGHPFRCDYQEIILVDFDFTSTFS